MGFPVNRSSILVLCFVVCMSIDKCFTKIKKFDFDLQSIVVNNDSIYIGGTNFLQRLSYDLVELAKVQTGPKLYSPYCINTLHEKIFCPQGYKTSVTDTDSINNVLLLTEQPQPSVLACSNLNQGECKLLSRDTLKNLYKNETLDLHFRPISANIENLSTVSLVSTKPHGLVIAKSITSMSRLIENKMFAISIFNLEKDVKKLLTPLEIDGNLAVIRLGKEVIKDTDSYVSKSNYEIEYKSIYSIDKSLYLTSVQQDLNNSEFISKIIHIETKFENYIEQPLSCESNGIKYNIIHSTSIVKLNTKLATVLKKDKNDQILFALFKSTRNPGKYAVCSYFISSMNTEFTKQHNNCRNRQDVPTASWLDDDEEKCTTSSFKYSNIRLAPTNPIKGDVLLNDHASELGAIEAMVHDDGLVVFLSTDIHPLQKFTYTPTGLYEYSKESFDGKPVFKKIIIDPAQKYLFMISNNMVVRSNIDDCLNRKSCFDCLSGPYCGWCTLSNKCTIQSEYSDKNKANYFISENTNKCPAISNVTPNVTSVNTVSKLSFTATNVPTDIKYQCKINDLILEVENVDSQFSCAKFDFSTIRPFNPLQGESKVEVSLVRKTSTGAYNIIATSQFIMYECKEFQMCKSCITGQFSCGWCSKSLTCFEKESECVDNLSWVSYKGYNSSEYQDICPSVQSSSTTFVSYDDEVEITLNGRNLPVPTTKFFYYCKFSYKKNIIRALWTAGVYKNDTTILCRSNKKLTYDSEEQTKEVQIELTYADKYIDTNQLSVQVYKCHVNRPDCNTCLSSPVDLKCSWCVNSSTCTFSNTCLLQNYQLNSNCNATSEPNIQYPTIQSFLPLETFIYNEQKITIRGENLGSSVDDIISVKVGGSQCNIVDEEYVISKLIVCVTVAPGQIKNGNITVLLRSNSGIALNATSTESFYFRVPEITQLQPRVGPCSGGTKIQLHGQFLNVGTEVLVLLHNDECLLMKRTSSIITCKTKLSCKDSSLTKKKETTFGNNLKVIFDGHVISLPEDIKFTYVDDPVIDLVYTNKRSIDLKTFASGRQVFTVEGQRFDTISVPQMLFTVYSPPMLKKSVCTVKSSSLMECLGPNMSDANIKSGKKLVLLGFEMDNVASIQKYRNFSVFPDPIFDKFVGDDNTLVVKDEVLVLFGKYLDVLDKNDVSIEVGGTSCMITDMDKRLICKLASKEEILKNNKGETIPVKITVGEGGLSYNVGLIKFYIPMEDDALLIYILLPTAFVLMLLIVAIVLCVIKHNKRNKMKKENGEVSIALQQKC